MATCCVFAVVCTSTVNHACTALADFMHLLQQTGTCALYESGRMYLQVSLAHVAGKQEHAQQIEHHQISGQCSAQTRTSSAMAPVLKKPANASKAEADGGDSSSSLASSEDELGNALRDAKHQHGAVEDGDEDEDENEDDEDAECEDEGEKGEEESPLEDDPPVDPGPAVAAPAAEAKAACAAPAPAPVVPQCPLSDHDPEVAPAAKAKAAAAAPAPAAKAKAAAAAPAPADPSDDEGESDVEAYDPDDIMGVALDLFGRREKTPYVAEPATVPKARPAPKALPAPTAPAEPATPEPATPKAKAKAKAKAKMTKSKSSDVLSVRVAADEIDWSRLKKDKLYRNQEMFIALRKAGTSTAQAAKEWQGMDEEERAFYNAACGTHNQKLKRKLDKEQPKQEQHDLIQETAFSLLVTFCCSQAAAESL
jgi:hypothetical protein